MSQNKDNNTSAGFEAMIGYKFPLSYIHFLEEHGETDRKYKVQINELGKFGDYGIQSFIAIDKVTEAMQRIEGLDTALVPLAYAEGGDIFAFSKAHDASIYLWSHEDLFPPMKVANSFDEFLDLIKEDAVIQEFTLGPGEDAWVDPAFRKKFPAQFEVKTYKDRK